VQGRQGHRSENASAENVDDEDDDDVWQTLRQLEEDITSDQPWTSK